VTSTLEELGVSCTIFAVINLPTDFCCDQELHERKMTVIGTDWKREEKKLLVVKENMTRGEFYIT
jgi:hypothetical protein